MDRSRDHPGTHALCTCGLSNNGPFCDGTHTVLTALRLHLAPSAPMGWAASW